jgi:hypothetical protein
MEYVKVKYPTSRTVFIDGAESGQTNTVLRVGRGTYTINLGEPRDYTPMWRRPTVQNTGVNSPMEVEFEEA